MNTLFSEPEPLFGRPVYQKLDERGCVTLSCEANRVIGYQLDLLVRQPSHWLAPCHAFRKAGQVYIRYDVTGLTPVDALSPEERQPAQGKKLLIDLCLALQAAVDVLLPLSQASLDPALVFVDRAGQPRLLFWPVDAAEDNWPPAEERDLPLLLDLVGAFGQGFGWPDDLIARIRESCSGDPGQLADVLQHLSLEAPAPALDEKPPVKSLASPKRSAAKILLLTAHLLAAAGALSAFMWPFPRVRLLLGTAGLLLVGVDLWVLYKRKVKTGSGDKPLARLSALFIEQAAPPPEDEPTSLIPGVDSGFRMAMLSQGKPGTAQEHEGLRVFLLTEEFLVGRDPRRCDLCLTQRGVGRLHARISRRAGSFFLEDLGSANGTRLDGRKIPKHTEVILPDQALIDFADQPFYFQAD